jgi:hypothetical protein
MARQPGLNRRGFSIRQKLHDPAPFEIADDRSIHLARLPLGPAKYDRSRRHNDLALAMNVDRYRWRRAPNSISRAPKMRNFDSQ